MINFWQNYQFFTDIALLLKFVSFFNQSLSSILIQSSKKSKGPRQLRTCRWNCFKLNFSNRIKNIKCFIYISNNNIHIVPFKFSSLFFLHLLITSIPTLYEVACPGSLVYRRTYSKTFQKYNSKHVDFFTWFNAESLLLIVLSKINLTAFSFDHPNAWIPVSTISLTFNLKKSTNISIAKV